MIPFLLDIGQLRTSSLSSRLEALEPVASEVELRAPDRVVASNPDPVAEWTGLGESKASVGTINISLPELEWSPGQEEKFLDLAGREAMGNLSPTEAAELERLTQLRRGLKNPRKGEELLWEYQQRELTRDLISALTRYVTFHNPSGRSSPHKS